MPKRLQPCLCIVAALALSALSAVPAGARIVCDGAFMVTRQGRIFTPNCGDALIAKVAQSYGWKTTAAEVGDKPLTKVYVCQVLGGDIRLKEACAGYGPEQYAPGH
jgi:hypothetical protein